jgi:hypothetical protein
MINIEESYELGLSQTEFYDLEVIQLKSLIREHGEQYFVCSRSMDNCSSEPILAIKLFEVFLLTEDLEVVSIERTYQCN